MKFWGVLVLPQREKPKNRLTKRTRYGVPQGNRIGNYKNWTESELKKKLASGLLFRKKESGSRIGTLRQGATSGG